METQNTSLEVFLFGHALETLPGRFSITMATPPVKTQELRQKEGIYRTLKMSSRACSFVSDEFGHL